MVLNTLWDAESGQRFTKRFGCVVRPAVKEHRSVITGEGMRPEETEQIQMLGYVP